MPSDLELVRSSFLRCEETLGFFDSFYENFFLSSPKVADAFAHTDMDHQSVMLRASLELLICSTEEQRALSHLKKIAEIHGHNGAAIDPGLFEYWIEALVDTVKSVDTNFDEETENAWRNFMQSRIDYIREYL